MLLFCLPVRQCRADKIGEQGMRSIGAGTKFGMELYPNIPRMVLQLDDLYQLFVW